MRLRTTLVALSLGVAVLPVLIISLFLSGSASAPSERIPDADILLVVGGFAFAILVVGNVLVARSVSRALAGLEVSAARLRSGDLSTPVTPNALWDLDISRVADALESLRTSLLEEEARRARLVMGISHDFRTPLALIRGYAESLGSGVAADAGRRSRYLSIIERKAGELDSLVEELLDYARTETDQRRAAAHTGDLRILVAQLAAEFQEDAAIAGRGFTYRDSLGTPVIIVLDERLIRRALENLLSNALRYTEQGGHIELELEQVAGDRIVLSLSDDGIGIPREEMERIFEPFYRASNAGMQHGHGLGLSIVKSVVEGMGWEISCSVRPGGGTRFSLIAPLVMPGTSSGYHAQV